MIMFEPNRLEPLVLQTAYRWVAPPVRKPLRHHPGPSLDTTGPLRDTRERSAQ